MKVIDTMPDIQQITDETAMCVMDMMQIPCPNCNMMMTLPEIVISNACDAEFREVIAHLYKTIEHFERTTLEMKMLMEFMKQSPVRGGVK